MPWAAAPDPLRQSPEQGNRLRLNLFAQSAKHPKGLCRKTTRNMGEHVPPTSHCELSTSFGRFPAPRARPSIGISRQNTEHRKSFTSFLRYRLSLPRTTQHIHPARGRVDPALHGTPASPVRHALHLADDTMHLTGAYPLIGPRSSGSPDIDAGLEMCLYIDQVMGRVFWLASWSAVISGWLNSLLQLDWKTGSMSRPAALRFRLAGRLPNQVTFS